MYILPHLDYGDVIYHNSSGELSLLGHLFADFFSRMTSSFSPRMTSCDNDDDDGNQNNNNDDDDNDNDNDNDNATTTNNNKGSSVELRVLDHLFRE